MKKVVVTLAFVLGSLCTVLGNTSDFNSFDTAVVMVQDFTEIKVADLPKAIMDALDKDHPGAAINKAYVNEDGQFKLEVTKEDGTSATLYADAEGNWISL